MPFPDFRKRRHFLFADGHRIFASSPESAAGLCIDGARHFPFQAYFVLVPFLFDLRIRDRDGGKQRLRVGMKRVII